MQSKNAPKSYPLHQSPLFRLRGKGQFQKALGVEWAAVDKLLSPQNYHVWINPKGREIQQPVGWLNHVHARIGKLIARIELPDYIYSRKGRSYTDNAVAHLGTLPLVKTDIHQFYPSTTRNMVFHMFLSDFECAEDVAHRLADICCYRQEHLPTGSPLSGRIAYFASKHMFDEISQLADAHGCRMTAYVDDVTISGSEATKKLLGRVRRLVTKHGLKTKQRKSKTFAGSAAKTVTGAVVAGDDLRLPNVRHKRIWETRKLLVAAPRSERFRLARVLRGRLQEASQIFRDRK